MPVHPLLPCSWSFCIYLVTEYLLIISTDASIVPTRPDVVLTEISTMSTDVQTMPTTVTNAGNVLSSIMQYLGKGKNESHFKSQKKRIQSLPLKV